MRLPRLAVLFASTTLLVSPSFADSTSLPLVAKLLGGLTDGGTMIQGSLGKGSVKATGDGAFDVTFDKALIRFLYDEPDTCIFTQHLQMGDQVADARMDFTKVTGVEVRDQGDVDGLHGALVTFQGPPETLQVVMGDKLVPQQPAFAFLASTLTVDDLNAAATELQRIC
jgi:hypothetical protein